MYRCDLNTLFVLTRITADMTAIESMTYGIPPNSGTAFVPITSLFLDNAINVYTYFVMFDLYQAALLPFVLLVRIVQLVGAIVFLKITWQ